MRHLAALIILSIAACSRGYPVTNQFLLAAQHDYGNARGFYLAIESNAEEKEIAGLEKAQLVLGVADGKAWRWISDFPKWEPDRRYSVKVVIAPEAAEMWLDGKSVGRSEGGFVPAEMKLLVNHIQAWANAPVNYCILQDSLKVTAGTDRVDLSFEKDASRPLPLILFDPQAPQRVELKLKQGETVTIEVTFRFIHRPDLHQLAPFVDRYGQCVYADWPGKVKSDADLKKAAAEEDRRLKEWGVPKDYDRYGGYKLAGWKEQGTGFYKLAKRGGYWWLVTPEGNPCFYIGMCTAPGLVWEMTSVTGREYLFEWLPPREAPYSAVWHKGVWGKNDGLEYVAIHAVNMIRKYGEDWEREGTESCVRRLKTLGFSGMGKWARMEDMTFMPCLSRGDVPNVARHPDVFDPEIQAKFKEALRKQIEPDRENPFVLGWSLGNEFDEIVTKDEVLTILKKPAETPAKRALVEFCLKETYGGDPAKMSAAWGVEAKDMDALCAAEPKPPAEDVERMRRFYADRYYEFAYRTVKELDPNHLYFGNWITPGWWEDEEDWRLIARHCDAIGYDYYTFEFLDKRLERLMREADKPVLYGEFSFPAFYDGTRGYGVYPVWAKDDAESGELYERLVKDAAGNPYCVGLGWFEYRDQPLTGRGLGKGDPLVDGEHYAFGIVDVTDRLKWDLVKRMREANLSAAGLRLKATKSLDAPKPK